MDGRRRALVVAQDRYDDPGLTQLRSPAQDAVALGDVLGASDIGGFEVEIVRNEASPTVAGRVEEFFAEGTREDALLLHFSCHGLKNPAGELFFAARDTRPKLLRSTAVSAQFVRACMTSSRARNTVLFLDCCFGGAFLEGMGVRATADAHVLDAFPEREMAGGRGWAVVTASNAIEYAFEGGRLTEDSHTPSVFTSALVAALTSGEADLDEDGRISLEELYDYLYDRVRAENPNQTPCRLMHVQGNVYLARSPRYHRALKRLPEQLGRALLDPDPESRRWGFGRLEAMATGTDIAAAASARDVLFWMTRQGFDPLTEDARRIVEATRITPLPDALDFGRIPQGGPAPSRTLRLLGPPLARRCTARPCSAGLRLHRPADATDDLVVTLDTGRLGRVDSSITLSGPSGEVGVPVTAEIVPAAYTGGHWSSVPPPRAAPAAWPPPQQATGRQAPHRLPPAAERPSPPKPAPVPTAQARQAARAERTAPPPDRRTNAPGAGTSRPADSPGLGRRALSVLIDLLVVGAAGWTLFTIVGVIGASVTTSEAPGSPYDILITIESLFIMFGWGLLVFLYQALMLGTLGRTVGMAALGVQVVDAHQAHDGRRPRWGQACARAAVFGLPQSLPFLGHLFVLFECLAAIPDRRNRAMHDQVAGTLMVFPADARGRRSP